MTEPPKLTIMTIMTKKTIPLARAKSQLSELVVRAAFAGEEFIITRRGRPAARLGPIRTREEKSDLADVRGWLSDEDPLFTRLQELRRRSRGRKPRVLRP